MGCVMLCVKKKNKLAAIAYLIITCFVDRCMGNDPQMTPPVVVDCFPKIEIRDVINHTYSTDRGEKTLNTEGF